MGRTSKVDPCMFCGVAPCECRKKDKPAPAPRKARATPAAKPAPATTATPEPVQDDAPAPEPVPVAPKRSAFAAMKARAKPVEKSVPVKPAPVLTNEDEEAWERAILALGSLLHPSERAKYSAVFSKHASTTLDERRAQWRRVRSGLVNTSR